MKQYQRHRHELRGLQRPSGEGGVRRCPASPACSVSLLTNSMGVEGTASSADIITAVADAGYGACVKARREKIGRLQRLLRRDEDVLKDHDTPVLKETPDRRPCGFLIVLMYFSMGHMMWGWPLPAFLDGNHVAMGLIQLLFDRHQSW